MKTIALTVLAVIFMSSAYAEEGDIGLFGRAVALSAGMVAKTAGQSVNEVSEKQASQDVKNAEAIRQRAKVKTDALSNAEEKSFEAATTGKR